MKAAFACPQCDATTQTAFDAAPRTLACAHCKYVIDVPADAIVQTAADPQVQRCLCCGSHELFIRKDFSQRLGVAIIAAGFIASTITWAYYWKVATYCILFGSALLDVVLYFTVRNVLECYRCHAQYRDVPGLDSYEPFSLETHEKYRQQAIRTQEAELAAHAAKRSG
jgi:hypothetical protein